LRRADLVIAIGETMAARLRAGGAENVAVAHEWIDGASVRPTPTRGHPVRRQRGWDDRVVFLYSGNLGLPHEFETILDAAELLRGRPGIVFAFIGHGARLQAVQREVARRGLSNVQFLPFTERAGLGDSLSAADVLLVTLRDGLAGLLLPVKAYAALAAGRPCLFVGPAECDVARFLAEGRCGARIAPGDARGLAEAVVRYADDEPSRRRDGERARQLFEERFDKPSGVARFRALIEGLDGQ
jgi:glycosyltransferase involved in cell wall biosynthesis